MPDLRLQWDQLEQLTRDLLFTDKRGDLGAYHVDLLNTIRQDRAVTEETSLLGLFRAPGSLDRHHAYEGGLAEHLLEMWTLWSNLQPVLQMMVRDYYRYESHTHLSDANVWRAILYHDLDKVWRYKATRPHPSDIIKYEYSNELDSLGTVLGPMLKKLQLLGEHRIPLTMNLRQAIGTSHGGYGEEPLRSHMTVLSKIIYILDELSANIVSRLTEGRYWESKAGGIDSTLMMIAHVGPGRVREELTIP